MVLRRRGITNPVGLEENLVYKSLATELVEVRKIFGQESVAITIGETVFI